MRFINRVSDYPNKKILHVSHASYLVNAYNTFLASTANSIVNVYWRGNNIEK